MAFSNAFAQGFQVGEAIRGRQQDQEFAEQQARALSDPAINPILGAAQQILDTTQTVETQREGQRTPEQRLGQTAGQLQGVTPQMEAFLSLPEEAKVNFFLESIQQGRDPQELSQSLLNPPAPITASPGAELIDPTTRQTIRRVPTTQEQFIATLPPDLQPLARESQALKGFPEILALETVARRAAAAGDTVRATTARNRIAKLTELSADNTNFTIAKVRAVAVGVDPAKVGLEGVLTQDEAQTITANLRDDDPRLISGMAGFILRALDLPATEAGLAEISPDAAKEAVSIMTETGVNLERGLGLTIQGAAEGPLEAVGEGKPGLVERQLDKAREAQEKAPARPRREEPQPQAAPGSAAEQPDVSRSFDNLDVAILRLTDRIRERGIGSVGDTFTAEVSGAPVTFEIIEGEDGQLIVVPARQ